MATNATREEMRFRTLFQQLVERVGDGHSIDEMLAAGVDAERVALQLHPLAAAAATVVSMAGTDERVDAVVTAGTDEWRVVFGYDTADRVTWLEVYTRPLRFDGVAGGCVIVVNGPSGAGKSVLMRALQSAAPFPLVVLDEPEHIGTVQDGYLIWRDTAPSLHRGFLAAAAALARAGNHVALSAAGHPQPPIAAAFDGVPLVSVGLNCDLAVLVDRERRTGRWAGIAAASQGAHDGWTYDLRFDTTDSPNAGELAALVLARLAAPDASADSSVAVSGTL